MKKLILALLLLVAPAAQTETPNIFQQFKYCTSVSNVYTHFATLATISKDDLHADFQDYVKVIASHYSNPNQQQLVIALGEMAWAARGSDETVGALQVYDTCVKKLGTST